MDKALETLQSSPGWKIYKSPALKSNITTSSLYKANCSTILLWLMCCPHPSPVLSCCPSPQPSALCNFNLVLFSPFSLVLAIHHFTPFPHLSRVRTWAPGLLVRADLEVSFSPRIEMNDPAKVLIGPFTKGVGLGQEKGVGEEGVTACWRRVGIVNEWWILFLPLSMMPS